MKSSMAGILLLLLSPDPVAALSLVEADSLFNISWLDSAGNPEGYEVYTAENPAGPWVLAATVNRNTHEYILQDLQGVYFRVRAFKTIEDEKVYSIYSDPSDRIVGFAPLGKPGTITIHIP